MKPVTDPGLIAQLEGDIVTGGGRKPVTDPRLLAELNAAPRRQVGAVEGGARGLGQGFSEQGNVLGLAAAGPAVIGDWIHGLFTGRPETRAQDFVFRNLTEPTREAVKFYEVDPQREELTTGGTVANVGGRLASMAPSMIASGGTTGPATGATGPLLSAAVRAREFGEAAKIAAPYAARGAVVAQPSFAVPTTVSRSQQLLEAGVHPDTVLATAIPNWLSYTAMGAAPVSAPGGLVTRAATGAGINVGFGAGQRAIEGEILGDENAQLAQPAFGGKEVGMDAGIGALMAAMFGPRAGGGAAALPSAPPADMNLPGDLSDFARFRPILEANGITDPNSAAAQMAVQALKAREARIAEQSVAAEQQQAPTPPEQLPWLRQPEAFVVDPQGRAAAARIEGDVVMPEGVRAGTPEAGTQAGMLSAEGTRASVEADAGRAFDVAQSQARRKQSGQDEGSLQWQPRDLREARAGGTTTAEGTAATAPQQFTFFNAKISDGQMVEGEQVEVVQDGLKMKDAKGKNVDATVVRFMDRDGKPEMPVPSKMLSTRERPANPRYAQDIAATAYAPPRGVGTGDQQPKPRSAGQRITTEPSPEVIPAQDQATGSRGEPPRQGDDVSDLAFERIGGRQTEQRPAAGKPATLPRPPEATTGARRALAAPEQQQPAPPARAAATEPATRGGGEPSAAEPPVTTTKQPAPAAPQSGKSLLQAIRAMGGIDSAAALDITGEKGFRASAGRDRVGVFRKRTKNERGQTVSGHGVDDLAARLRDIGYDIPRDTVDGGAQALRDMVRAELDGRTKHYPGGRGEDATFEAISDSELRTADESRRRAESERSRVENAPPEDFTLSGSDRPVDKARARGQTELFANPIGPMAEAVGKALGWVAGTPKQWSDSISGFVRTITDVKDRVPSPEGGPVVRFMRAVLDSASGDVRAVLKKFNSPTADWVVDQFHTMSGADRVSGETYQSAVAAWTNKNLTRLHKAVGEYVEDRKMMEQISNLVRNPAGINKNTPVGKAAAEVRAMLDDALKYMRDAGVEVGEVKGGYFPREYDVARVLSDPQGFIKGATQAYQESGMPADRAKMAAEELHDSIVYGETSSLFKANKGNTQAPFIKGRVFGKEVDSKTHPLNKFLVSDPALAIPIYLQRVARRAEIARRFGDKFAHWEDYKDAQGKEQKGIITKIREEGGSAAAEKLRDYVMLAAGLKPPGESNMALRASSLMRTWGSLMFLEKATLSSLTEFIVPAIRAGNVLDVGRSIKNTIADLVNKTEGAKERRELAEDLGIVTAHLADTINAARFSGGDPVSLAESKILDKYFRRTGLTQWTDATRVASMDIGRVFIRRLAKQEQGKLSLRYLKELGIPEAKADAFVKFVNGTNDGMPQAGQIKGDMGGLYRAAVRRFVLQSIMQPDATMRPAYMKTWWGSLLGQLQSFNYAFYENVLKRNARLAKEGFTGADYSAMERAKLLMPTMMLPLLWGAAYAIGEGRDAVLGDPNRREEEDFTDKAIKAASRGVPIAPIDPLLNYATSARYQRGAAEFVAGPVLGTAARGADAARNVLLNNSPNTNTAERQAVKVVYDLFVEPAVNLALTASPVTLAAAAATQAVGAGTTREEMFIEPIAGEKQNSRKRSAAVY